MPLQKSRPLTLGSPRFADAALAACARTQGAEAAWRAALAAGDVAEALRGVQGPFAVAWSSHGRTVLAVDRFAVHTLCWRLAGTELHWSDRADALADATPQLSAQSLFDYLYFHAIASPRTVYEGIHRVPPGHFVLFEQGRVKVEPYWIPDFRPDARAASFEELRYEFRVLLREAVRRELDDGKPGCFLSGGTDSSTVAGMVREACGRRAATYSIGFEAEGYDEMAFARIAARHFGTEHHEYYVTPADLVKSIADVAGSYDQPFGNSSALPAYYCARMARDDGVSKILAGDGGDELFGGNSRYAKQRVFSWYGSVPGPLRTGLLQPVFGTRAARALPLVKKGSSYIEQARVPMPDRLQMYNLLRRLGPAQVLTEAFLRQVDVEGPARQQREVWAMARADHELDRTLAFDWRYTLAESDLPKVCGTTRLAEIGVGFPLLDPALADFSMKLPVDYKLKGFKLRWFFKEALRGFLPDEILAKRKQGFGLPFGVWTTRSTQLKAMAVDSLRSLGTRGIVRSDFMRELTDTLLPQYPGYYGELVWILMILELWLQRHASDFRVKA